MSKARSPDAEVEDPDEKGKDWLERNAVRLDFMVPRDEESDSWQRAKDSAGAAEYEQLSDDLFRIELPDGDPHVALLVADGGDADDYVGACGCEGFEYHGMCAHLCALAQTDVVGDIVRRDETRAGELEGDGLQVEHVDHGADQEDDGPMPGVDECVHCGQEIDDGHCPDCDGPVGPETVEAEPVEADEPQGSDTEDRPAPASTSAETPDTPSNPFAGGLDDVPDEYVMTLGGDKYIRRAGYARLARHAGFRIDPEEVVGAHETDWTRSKYRVRVVDEDGAVVATDVGTAHADHEDMDGAEANLDELALTRAATRALAWATGEGISAVAEVAPAKEPHQ